MTRQMEQLPELQTFTGHAAGIFQLSRRIRNAKAGLEQALNARFKASPHQKSHTVTKAALRDRVCRLEGMLAAYMYVTGRWDHAGLVTDDAVDRAAWEIFKIDMSLLRREVKDS